MNEEIAPESNIPLRLQELPQPPKKLFLKGILPDFEEYKFLTVVGSRKHTTYGRDACEKIIEGLKGYKIVIVSGLALGIDTIAHKSALKNGLITIAVPGSGFSEKVLYPRSNIMLAREIVESGGAILSEFEPELQAAIWTFPQRNRIMAGLSDAVLIIEAEEKSGTLITARMALDYNKTILAVPGNIFSQASFGTNRLIKEGAYAITEARDVLLALGINPHNEEVKENKYDDCTPDELEILEILIEPMARDEIVSKLDKDIGDINATLSLLEIKGYVKEELGLIQKS
jgi:DNA processing protein